MTTFNNQYQREDAGQEKSMIFEQEYTPQRNEFPYGESNDDSAIYGTANQSTHLVKVYESKLLIDNIYDPSMAIDDV